MSDRDGLDVRSLAAAFRAGTQLAPHHHAWGQLIFAASGVMQVHTATATWLTPSTRAIWLPAGMSHAIDVRSDIAMRTLYLHASRASRLGTEPRVVAVSPLLRELILHILAIGMLRPAQPAHDRLAGLLLDLLVDARDEDLMLPLPRDARALRLARHVLKAPDDRRELATIAADVGASLRTLQRLFPQQTGLTMENWRQKARLVHAVACLAEGESIASTALACGYQSSAAFSAAFAQQFGLAPSVYRRHKRAGETPVGIAAFHP